MANAKRDGNFVPGGDIGEIQQLNLTTKWPQTVAILDASGNQVTSFGGSPASDGSTGSAVPSSASYGGINVSGTLRGVTGVNPSGSVYAQQTDLASIGGTSFALGQAFATASLPVVLTATQLSTLTPLSSVAVTQSTSPWVVSGAVTNTVLSVVGGGTEATAQRVTLASDSTGVLTVKQATAGNLNMTEASAASSLTSLQLIDDVIYTSGDTLSKTAGIAAQFDDVSPGAVTENKMAPVRMSSRREVYTTIRDAAGNERGLNVDTNGAIAVTATNATASNLKVAATLDAETTKVIGVTRTADGGGNLLTSNSTTYTAKFGLDSNLLGTLGTAFSTAGKVDVKVASGDIASGAIASGAVASGAFTSGSISSGALASGALAAGSIAVGAITAGNTSIATTEDTARAGAEHLVKVGLSRLDTPVANANVDTDGDYTNFTADNFGKLWVSGTVPEDTAHVAGEAITVQGSRRIGTLATSSGTDADWSTVNQTAEGAAWNTLAGTATPNGLSVANFTSGDTYTALTNTAQVIKASAGNLYGYYMYNPNSSATYVMVYNIAAASVTVGTSTAILVFCLPATSGANLLLPIPIPFSNAGWSAAAATTGGGASAPAIALEVMFWYL